MRAKVTKGDILPTITRTVSVADRKSVVPILSHVLLEFNETGLRIKATDLDHSIMETVKAEIDTFGCVAVPAVTLNDIIRKSPENSMLEFSLMDKGHKLSVTAGKSRFELSTLDPADFPEIPTLKNTCNFSVKSSELSKLISRTKFSISPEESRHNLGGIYLHKEDSRLKAASTDGHRLSVSYIETDIKEHLQGVIISRKAIAEVKKLLDSFTGDVTLTFSATQVQFSIGDVIFISKLVEGTFPDYKRVIPEMSADFFVVNRTAFSEIVDRVAVISDDKVRSIKLELNRNVLYFYSVNSKVGSGRDEMEVTYAGPNWNGGFNAGYLLDVAQTLSGETLKVYVRDSLASILLLDESEPESLFVIMPMRI
ncbi:MAG: DNA polymerase III subunit beta [Holosporaceae bacterium]|jgi:DNA polymerase-3 subunit beta|nr:DNA polymerase III subunit beta [Holosporaceae bacterium]